MVDPIKCFTATERFAIFGLMIIAVLLALTAGILLGNVISQKK